MRAKKSVPKISSVQRQQRFKTLLSSAEPLVGGTSARAKQYRFVVDTSVLISAIFYGGKAELVLRHVTARHTLIVSDFIIEEFVAFTHTTPPKTPQKFIRLVRTKLSEYCRDYEPDNTIAVRDINDTDIIALARTYQAAVITSDKDLLECASDSHTSILSLNEVIQLFDL